MTSARNGSGNGYVGQQSPRRFRVDGKDHHPPSPGPSRSGRRFAIAAALGLLAVWGAIGLAFRDWQIQHEAIATYGAHDVATLVDRLKSLHPPGIDYLQWVDAVEDTHLMLVRLTASGLFDRQAMLVLHDDIQRRVDGATSDTGQATLAKLWDDMEHKAGPILLRKTQRSAEAPHRPELLGPSDPRLLSRRVWPGA